MQNKKPQAIIQFELYKDGVNFCGVADVGLPDITYLTQAVSGAGMGGNIEAVLVGMVEAMTTTIKFLSITDDGRRLAAPTQHVLDLRAATQNWNSAGAGPEISADKYVMTVMPKSFKPGKVAPASASDASGEYATYYYAAYKDGKTVWEIDPNNYICLIDGVDYLEPVRKALGR